MPRDLACPGFPQKPQPGASWRQGTTPLCLEGTGTAGKSPSPQAGEAGGPGAQALVVRWAYASLDMGSAQAVLAQGVCKGLAYRWHPPRRGTLGGADRGFPRAEQSLHAARNVGAHRDGGSQGETCPRWPRRMESHRMACWELCPGEGGIIQGQEQTEFLADCRQEEGAEPMGGDGQAELRPSPQRVWTRAETLEPSHPHSPGRG